MDGAALTTAATRLCTSASALTRSRSTWSTKNIAGGACTVTLTDAGQNFRAEMLEASGLDTTSPLDQTTSAAGTSAAPSSGSITTTTANQLLVCYVGTDGGNSFTAGSGWTLQQANSDVAIQIETQIVSSIGTYAGTMSITSAGYAARVASFKATASASLTDDDAGWMPQPWQPDTTVSVW